MADQTVLSDLCTTCYTKIPKYRCPRCSARTCSLPCYKRHQQRSSCSGKRDPATYVKKSQWATPAGVDHDYNYLKVVERTIDDASQDVQQRGIGVNSATSKTAARAWQAGSALQKYLSRNRIIVEHAPKGMSRRKTNETRITKSNKVVWTVEWIDASGARHLQHDCLEADSIAELHTTLVTEQCKMQKRYQGPEQAKANTRKTKRQRQQEESSPQGLVNEDVQRQQGCMPHSGKGERTAETCTEREAKLEVDGLPKRSDADKAVEQVRPADTDEAKRTVQGALYSTTDPQGGEATGCLVRVDRNGQPRDIRDDASSHRSPLLVDIKPELERPEGDTARLATPDPSQHAEVLGMPSQMPESRPTNYYYLSKPGTPSTHRVLIPLDSDSTLTGSLHDRVVQEYPTIYVLPDAPDSLPECFTLESDYARGTRNSMTSHRQCAAMETNVAGGGMGNGTNADSGPDQLDASSILEMLKRDITA